MADRTTVRLPPAVTRSLKRTAAAEGTTMTALLEEGARRVLDARKNREQKPRIMPRVSSARGGLKPGVGLIDLSALQEADDIEYVERMNRGFR